MTPTQIARVCHEVNRAYCQSLGDDSQPAPLGAADVRTRGGACRSVHRLR
jgi:hypothetical protein